ncbi:MAG: metallophosphoesterase, partial [Verrucomicrobiales bacterium]|nr:metallophosphoesterase [Verrucomicrobiales bacterium]
ETYTFFTYSDDGVRLWVNNQLLVDNWTDHGYTENAGVIALQAGYLYDVKMEFYENGGGAAAKLWWSSPTVFKDVIPSAQLYPPAIASNLPPTVALTNPVPGSVFVSGSSVGLVASATDPDGLVAKVAFFNGTNKLGEALALPYALTWSNVAAGTWTLSAVATDDGGISRTSAPVSVTVVAGFSTNVTLVSTGSVWKYRDTGENLGSAWTGLGFVDTNWASGPAELGYGDGVEGRPEPTIVSYGPDAANKYITTYFRTYFNVADPNAFSILNFRVMRDDGVVIYINGSEVFRSNMPGGPINYLTPASAGVGGVDEYTFFPGSDSSGYLIFGTNVVAAEIHQSSGGSSDISFDFELMASKTVIAPYITNQPQSQAVAEGTTVTLGVAVQGTDPLRFQWRFNGVTIFGATNASLVFPGIATNQAGGYSVVITNTAGSVTSAVANVTVSVLDTDGDGIPDLWEKAHGLNYQVNDANLDPDHDGMTNLQEYLAGTDPQRADSYLRVDSLALGASGSAITFLAMSNHTYSVLANESLNPTGWTNVGNTSARTTNRAEVILDPRPQSPLRYYRLVTPAMP